MKFAFRLLQVCFSLRSFDVSFGFEMSSLIYSVMCP